MEGIEISQSRIGARSDIALLTVRGYVDTMTCSDLLVKITENLKNGLLHVVVDMAQVHYVSSAGWGVFVGEIKGIREQGGDLKIVQMTPEVYDVFEMLEFHRILSYYECIEEAINDFDYSIGLDITKSVKKSFDAAETVVEAMAPLVVQRAVPKSSGLPKSRYVFKKQKLDEKLLPVTEKVKLVVIEDPRRGLFKIRAALNTTKFGYTKIHAFQLYGLLRKLGLETKEKRFRFYRSR